MKRRTFLAASIGVLAGAEAGASSAAAAGPPLHTAAAQAFGTTVTVTVAHADGAAAQAAMRAALREAQAVDRLMSIYDPASQVYQLNRDGVLPNPHNRLLLVLAQARALALLTDGAFDVTVQPLWLAYAQAAERGGLPDALALSRARALVGWRQLAFKRGEVRFLRPGMALTLNGLAQGYAADLALAALRRHGIRNALLDTGEFAASGAKPPGLPWALGIRDPRDAGACTDIVLARDRCLATSGDYESVFTQDRVHHHILDPERGDSPPELAGVTVLAPSALLADGLSTAFMVMGAKKAHALAGRLPGIDLLTVDKQGRARRSPGFAAAAGRA
ncbi:thiamine biosynthesis protein ApbE [Massilia sp. Root351]|jgi:thiamine biosynthesis lipoprotein|uniref:FAD:protein FMN transferase n=1 Tax=Massilia sp. Root351 TaxID=1736522 RepID=UPI00070B92B3|nr:FAD:protein FMN transferase [Massilia sp. Root351]KQV83905.1 thiamine biosynthesis protein ApbE [Massilia sp. Root351]